MSRTDYGEILCQATEILAQQLIDKVSYDKTLLCTIITDDEKNIGKYQVQNSEAIFDAYTSDTSFKKGDQVYVSVPMGDWNEQKLIVAKKMKDINQPITYIDPFESYVNITNNLIDTNLNQQGLIANGEKESVLLWSYNKENSEALVKSSGEALGGYTRLAIGAEFQAWLKELGIVIGEYGLGLVIEVEPEDAADIENVQTNKKICLLNCQDMTGNPYNYDSFYSQKKLFDISTIKNIKSMELYFYQKKGSFLNYKDEIVPPHTLPNIFVKDITISFGYDAESFEDDTLIIYTLDSVKYDVKKIPSEDNHKKLNVRWIHRFENGQIKVVQIDDEINYELTWYRYQQGARSHTTWSGVDWIPLSSQIIENGEATYQILDPDWKKYNQDALGDEDKGILPNNSPFRNISYNQSWLLPDTTRAEERIKAIINVDGQIIESDILFFSNVDEVVNKATLDAIQALTINCEDGSFGNYLIYDLGGKIIDQADASEVRRFKAYFNSAKDDVDDNEMAELIEAESIEWIIPAENTMIDVSGFFSDLKEEEPINGYYHIIRYGEPKVDEETGELKTYYIKHQNDQRYRIKSFYTHNYSNNTIKCIITKDKIKYTTTKELTFGPAGTSGTDYTFVLDFEGDVTALTLASDYDENETIPATMIRARLYDYTGQEVSGINDKNIYWTVGDVPIDDILQETVAENDFVSIVLQNEDKDGNKQNDLIEIKLKDSVVAVPDNNYTILKAVLKSARTNDQGWGDYDLYAYLPIPIRSSRKYQFISGTTSIIYNSLGYLDSYFQNPYCLYYMNENEQLITENGVWDVNSADKNDPYLPKIYKNSSGQYYIRPVNIYSEGSMKNLCSYGKVDEKIVWSQPLHVIQNKYPSSILNEWNGELKIDADQNVILAAKIAAGKKNSDDNTFSGVIMGDWSGNNTSDKKHAAAEELTKNTGLYGFYHGSASFGFRDDGTAFIGRPGYGRLEFDGDKSVIQSNKMANNEGGLLLDFDDGLIKMINPDNATLTGTIQFDAGASTTPFTIGSNFWVNWDGTLHAENGEFSGNITASRIDGGEIYGSYVEAADINGGTITGATIKAGTLASNNDENRIYLDGYISLKDRSDSYFGAMSSNIGGLPDYVNQADGLGMRYIYSFIKATAYNVGMSFYNWMDGYSNYFYIDDAGIYIGGKSTAIFSLERIKAENQKGIYARFA